MDSLLGQSARDLWDLESVMDVVATTRYKDREDIIVLLRINEIWIVVLA